MEKVSPAAVSTHDRIVIVGSVAIRRKERRFRRKRGFIGSLGCVDIDEKGMMVAERTSIFPLA